MKHSKYLFNLSILLLLPIWNSCFFINQDDGSGDPVPSATNVVAIAGDAQATISWQYGTYGAGFQIQYPIAGGAGEDCYIVTDNDLNGCRVGCNVSGSPNSKYSCTVSGLTNGTSYTFTVIVNGFNNRNPSHTRTNAIIPMAGISN